ncbi:phosphotriesterase-related protein [Venturia canescens]|uniref:phosphotriesterase-related protein n=1 Tax=Venturia canescens TaxID=32260 RepID=UPI001C9BCCAE|nr:phosphotriesterase-related protein [Venturia canescens]
MADFVETVLGPTKLTQLGRTLTHEHLALDFDKFYVPPPKQLAPYFSDRIDLSNVGFHKQYPYSNVYNVKFNDEDARVAVLEDVKLYKKFGGGTIVENTSHGLKRDIPLMKRISQESGVHVILGTGHYVALTQNNDVISNCNEEKMRDLMTRELTIGCEDDPSVRAGIIGEVGSGWPMHEFEKRAIRASARVQAEVDAPVTFHPGRNGEAPFEIIRIYLEAGGAAKRAIMSHLDRTLLKEEELVEFAKIGCYCQLDLFGTECSYYQLDEATDMPSDAQRIDKLKLLKDEGRLDRLLMSHDIHTKHRLVNFGGHGYAHIINNVLPKMRLKGFTESEIDVITIDNPREWLTRRRC